MAKRSKRKGRTLPQPNRTSNVPAGPALGRPLGEVPLGEGQSAQPVGEVDDPIQLVVPTIALRSIAAVAKADSLEMLIDEDLEKQLLPSGKHMLVDLMRVFNADGTDFVRSRAMLQLANRPLGHGFEVFLDFPTRYIGMLLDQVGPVQPETPKLEFKWQVPKPTWAGSYSFGKVWDQCSRIATHEYQTRRATGGGDSRITPRGVMAMSTLVQMKEAHLVRVDPEQVQVLPDWEDPENLWDYAQDVVLPFERIYLDFEGPGGFAPVHDLRESLSGYTRLLNEEVGKYPVEIRGAMVWRDTDGKLVVTAVGWSKKFPHLSSGISGTQAVPMTEYEPVGQVVFGSASMMDRVLGEIGEMTLRLGDTELYSRPLGLPTSGITEKELAGYVQIPADHEMLDRQVDRVGPALYEVEGLSREQALDSIIRGWAALVLSCAGRAMAALSILEADEVELVEAPMEKRVRDRAVKRGWPLAQIVFIRSSRKYLTPNPPSGEEARYSHRFWVRAHTKHYPLGTRVADSRPDMTKPCHRCGVCRRVSVKAFIKGPPDKPLVPKSLAVRKRTVPVTQLPVREDAKPYYAAPGVV